MADSSAHPDAESKAGASGTAGAVAPVAATPAPDLTLKESDAPLPESLATDAAEGTAASESPETAGAGDDGATSSSAPGRGGKAVSSERGRGGGRGAGGPGQYLNRERHRTGGPQRAPLTEDELSAKLERARLQNAAILARREQVEADKSQYEQLTAKEREERAEHARKKLAEKKAQLEQEEERAKARARKLEKQDARSWDSEKQDEQLWQANYRPYAGGDVGGPSSGRGSSDRGRGRGGARGGASRGGSRGGGNASSATTTRREQVNVNDDAQFPSLSAKQSAPPKAEKKATKASEAL